MFKRIRWWWYRRQKGYPCQEEIKALLPKIAAAFHAHRLSQNIRDIASFYAYYGSLSYVATEFKITRERVRQCLIKARYRALDTKGRYL